MVKDHAHTTSCSICGEIKMTTFRIRSRSVSEEEEEEEEEEYGEFDDSRTGRLRYIYSTLSIFS